MKKNLGKVPAVYPMPVLMVAAYDESGKVNVMNAAWGMILPDFFLWHLAIRSSGQSRHVPPCLECLILSRFNGDSSAQK